MLSNNRLNSISPVDGRYFNLCSEIGKYFSEHALIQHRIFVELEYFLFLVTNPCLRQGCGRQVQTRIRKLSKKEINFLENLKFKNAGQKVKKIEAITNHDVKAVEYYLKENFKKTSLNDLKEFLHFALTSEDTNSLSYGIILSKCLSDVIIPELKKLQKEINGLAIKYSNIPLLARTHGQVAAGTSFGKEFKVFSERLLRQIKKFENWTILVKFSGAVGNYNAHMASFPEINWLEFSERFIEKLNKNLKIKLSLNKFTTQIEPHDKDAELFDTMRRINTILIDFCQDLWRYISDELIVQKFVKGETGSSTMPHKINPINFENAEGNLGIANAMFEFFSRKLPVSRLQRDLSDSTVKRNFGVAFAHSLLAYKYVLKGLKKIEVNSLKAIEQLKEHPEIYAEGIQTILRREGIENAYEKLKDFTRGTKITISDLENFIDNLEIKEKVKKELKTLLRKPYIGLAPQLAKMNLK